MCLKAIFFSFEILENFCVINIFFLLIEKFFRIDGMYLFPLKIRLSHK